MKAKVKLTWVDRDGNAACSGMDEVVEMDGHDEQNILDGATAAAVHHWYDDLRVQRGEIEPVAEIVETG